MDIKNKLVKLWKLIKSLPVKQNPAEQDLVLELFSLIDDKSHSDRVMIDVGAQFGSSFMKFSKLGWTIYCFEPDDHKLAILKNNIKKQHFKKVFIDNKAVSDIQTNAMFYKSDISTGISSLIKFHPSHKEFKEVEVTTLSAFCDKNGIGSIDFLKTDTEGNDLKVIQGLDLNNHPPAVILCEYEDFKTKFAGYTKEDMTGFLLANGFRCFISEWYPIIEYGKHHKWKKITDDISLTDTNSWGNIIAIRPHLQEHFIKIIYKRFRKNKIRFVNQ